MKRSNKLFILLGVLVVFCIATFAVLKHEEHKEKIKNTDKIVLEIPVDSVNSLSWKNKSETLAFHKEGDKWVYDKDEAFPVDQEKIRKLLGVFEKFGAAFIIEEVEDFGQYGLNNPTCTINLFTAEESYEILVGDFSIMDQQRYVSVGDGNVYLVRNDPMEHYGAVLKDMIDNDEPPKFDKAVRIQLDGDEKCTIVYQEGNPFAYREDDVYYAQKGGYSLPVDANRVKSYLNSISNLDLSNYVTYRATGEELGKYGLDNPEFTVTVDYTSKDEKDKEVSGAFVLHVSRDPEEKKKAEKAARDETDDKKESESSAEEEITAYARVGESQIVYQISSNSYKILTAANYDSFRHLEVLPAPFDDVNRIDISLDGESYSFTSEKKGDKRTWYYREEELDIAAFRDALEKLKAESFTDEKPSKKEEIGLTFRLDNKNYPEIRISLYRYDGTHCLAVIDGRPASLVRRSDAVNLIEAVYAVVLD